MQTSLRVGFVPGAAIAADKEIEDGRQFLGVTRGQCRTATQWFMRPREIWLRRRPGSESAREAPGAASSTRRHPRRGCSRVLAADVRRRPRNDRGARDRTEHVPDDQHRQWRPGRRHRGRLGAGDLQDRRRGDRSRAGHSARAGDKGASLCGRPPSPLSHRPAPGRRGAEGRRLRLRRRRQRRRQAPEHRPGGRDRRLRVDSPGGPRQGGGVLRGPGGSRAEEHRRAGARSPPRRGRTRPGRPAVPSAEAPASLRSWRRRFERRNVLVMAAVLASAVALAVWFAFSGRPVSSGASTRPTCRSHRFPFWCCRSPIRPATRRRPTSPMP